GGGTGQDGGASEDNAADRARDGRRAPRNRDDHTGSAASWPTPRSRKIASRKARPGGSGTATPASTVATTRWLPLGSRPVTTTPWGEVKMRASSSGPGAARSSASARTNSDGS